MVLDTARRRFESESLTAHEQLRCPTHAFREIRRMGDIVLCRALSLCGAPGRVRARRLERLLRALMDAIVMIKPEVLAQSLGVGTLGEPLSVYPIQR